MDLIERQAAIDAIDRLDIPEDMCVFEILSHIELEIGNLPPAESEPAIPLSWIEGQIRWLRSLDNAFSALTADLISAMVNKWKDEQKGGEQDDESRSNSNAQTDTRARGMGATDKSSGI